MDKEKNNKEKSSTKKDNSNNIAKNNSSKLIKKYKKLKKELDEVRAVLEERIKKGIISIDELLD